MSTQPEALRLAESLSRLKFDVKGAENAVAMEQAAAELRHLQRLIDSCALYLKEGETPAERIARDHADRLVLMELLAKEKHKNEALLHALKEMLENGQDYTAVRDKARAAIKAVEGEKA